MQLYQYPIKSLNERLFEIKSKLQPGADFVSVACQLTARKLAQSKLAYLEFGPYWWSVKRIMADNGFALGSARNEFFDGKYSSESDELTMTAAWNCLESIRREYLKGSRDFTLTDDGEEVFSLFDSDMEV